VHSSCRCEPAGSCDLRRARSPHGRGACGEARRAVEGCSGEASSVCGGIEVAGLAVGRPFDHGAATEPRSEISGGPRWRVGRGGAAMRRGWSATDPVLKSAAPLGGWAGRGGAAMRRGWSATEGPNETGWWPRWPVGRGGAATRRGWSATDPRSKISDALGGRWSAPVRRRGADGRPRKGRTRLVGGLGGHRGPPSAPRSGVLKSATLSVADTTPTTHGPPMRKRRPAS